MILLGALALLAAPLPPMGVEYRCPPAPPASTCAPSPKWLPELVEAAHQIQSTQGPHHDPPPTSYCEWAEDAVKTALAHPVEALTDDERIVTQHAALRLAMGKGCDNRRDAPRAAAARLAARVALDAKTLQARATPPVLEGWLPAPAGWVDLKGNVPLNHDMVARFLLAFRPIRAGGTRAIFGRIIAFDRAWRPHITALVARVELRGGTTPTAPACVVKLDPKRLRCDTGRMRPLHVVELPSHRFGSGFLRSSAVPGRAGCDGCHGPGSQRMGVGPGHPFFGDLAVLPDAAAHLKARRKALMTGVSATVTEIKALLK